MKSLCLAVLLGLATVATSYPPYIQAERPPWQEAEVEQGGRPPILDTPWPPMQEVEEQQQDLSSSADIARNTFRQLLGQSLCQSYAAATGLVYPIYAVGRKCEDPSAGTCHAICKDKTLHAQETNPTIRNSLWINWRSFRIFEATPPFTSGGVGTAKLGMKTEYYVNPHVTGCGPNICCCLAHTIHAG